MRVTIEHGTIAKGILSSTVFNAVNVAVEFSDEERHIIESQNLKHKIIHKRDPSADLKVHENDNPANFYLRIQDVLNSKDTWTTEYIFSARDYAVDVVEGFKELKEFLNYTAEIPKDERRITFEL